MNDPPVSRRDPLGLRRGGEGAITGSVVCAAAIAAATSHLDSIGQLSLVIVGTIGVYWIAHVHALTIGAALARRHHPVLALRRALRETVPIVGASVVPLGVLILASLAGVDVHTAAWIALGATVALLTFYSWLAGARGGLEGAGQVACAGGGAFVGLLVVLLKAALH